MSETIYLPQKERMRLEKIKEKEDIISLVETIRFLIKKYEKET